MQMRWMEMMISKSGDGEADVVVNGVVVASGVVEVNGVVVNGAGDGKRVRLHRKTKG